MPKYWYKTINGKEAMNKHAAGDGTPLKLYFSGNGKLSINKPVVTQAVFEYVSDPAKPVYIRDFGMEPPRILMLRVEPEVVVRVEIVAVREG